MGLFVKWGSEIQVAEAQTLYTIRQNLEAAVPVPEIYGWRTDGEEVFIYMEAIKGRTLEKTWQQMEDDDRTRICNELRAILDSLRRLKQDPAGTFIGKPNTISLCRHTALSFHLNYAGNIARGPLYDRAISDKYLAEAGPFSSVKEFHDWFTSLYRRPVSDPENIPDPFRQELPDDSDIVFTHGDLHPSNMILSSRTPFRVMSIIDWEQAGWLPAYWEDRKAHFPFTYFGEWSEKYLPLIMDQHKRTWRAWDYYTISMGFSLLRTRSSVVRLCYYHITNCSWCYLSSFS
jgi:hypothetical protein